MSAATAFPAFQRPALRRPLAWLLAVALCLAATLGFIHRVLHFGAPVPAYAAGVIAAAAVSPDHAPAFARPGSLPHDGWHALVALFDGHDEGDLQCRLYDQLSQGSALPSVAMLLLPVVLPTAVFDFMQGEVLARWVLLFDARGPPAGR